MDWIIKIFSINRVKHSKYWITAVGVIFLSLSILIFKSEIERSQDDSGEVNTVSVVETFAVKRQTLRLRFSLYSPLLPEKEATIRPIVSGIVEELPVSVGSKVEKNQAA